MTPSSNPAQAGTPESVSIVHNEAGHRFEAGLQEGTAVLEYRYDDDGALVLVHTGVPEAVRHHGLGERLVQTALEFARDRRLAVVPVCPFVKSYLEHHPEYQTLVRPS